MLYEQPTSGRLSTEIKNTQCYRHKIRLSKYNYCDYQRANIYFTSTTFEFYYRGWFLSSLGLRFYVGRSLFVCTVCLHCIIKLCCILS